MSPVDNLKSAKGFLPAMKRSKRSLTLQLCIESYPVGKLELCLLHRLTTRNHGEEAQAGECS